MKPLRSLSEVGEIMQIDRREVWYIEKRAFAKLRKKLAHLNDKNGVKSTRGETNED